MGFSWKEKLPVIVAAAAGLVGVFYLLLFANNKSEEEEEDEEEDIIRDNGGSVVTDGKPQPVVDNYCSPSTTGNAEPTRNCHDLEKLVTSLDEEDPEVICSSLKKLCNLAAFRDLHRFIIVGLPKVVRHLQLAATEDIQIEAANLINNLALNEDNQTALSRLIPVLLNEMKLSRRHSAQFTLAASRALTNLSLFDDNHQHLLPNLVVLAENLDLAEEDVKVQILKVLVNLSTNERTTETCLEVDAQIISTVSPYVIPEENETILLRAITCIANILGGLHSRLKNNRHPQVYAPEFVSDVLQTNLERLVSHSNQDIRLHAGRALFALRPPVLNGQSARLDDADMLEVLKTLIHFRSTRE